MHVKRSFRGQSLVTSQGPEFKLSSRGRRSQAAVVVIQSELEHVKTNSS